MSFALKQTVSNSSTGGVATTTAALATTVNGGLVVVTTNDDSNTDGVIIGISCTGMSFTMVNEITATGSHVTFWYSSGNGAATTPTLTVTNNQGGGLSTVGIIVREYSGGVAGGALDQHVITTGDNAAPNSGATPTLVGSNDLVIGYAGTLDSGNTYTAGAGFSDAVTLKVGTTLDMGMEDKFIKADDSAETAAFTITNSDFWGCGVATFLALPHVKFNNTGLRPYPFSPGNAR